MTTTTATVDTHVDERVETVEPELSAQGQASVVFSRVDGTERGIPTSTCTLLEAEQLASALNRLAHIRSARVVRVFADALAFDGETF